MRLRLGHLLVVALAGLTPAAPADAQQDACEEQLARAREKYQLGLFDEVENALDACDKRSAKRSQQVRAYALRAKAAVEQYALARAEAAVQALLQRSTDFAPEPDDPPLFVDMLARAKTGLVGSVSKVLEDWREAPATVLVLTAEEILRRGYLDLEAVLHDLPGFDISRTNGDAYANIYQRGYRSNATDRTLLLVDGIEQNDLHSNIAYLSRQYPLSNVHHVEVVYGPASTIYGPNAFSGVINIVTVEPDALVADGRRVAAIVLAGGGSYGTGYLDATVAGRAREGHLAWSVTARGFRSDERDLSGLENWRFAFPGALDQWNYRETMLLEGKTLDKYLCLEPAGDGDLLSHPERCAAPNARVWAGLQRAQTEGLVEMRDANADGRLDVALTDRGVALARALDRVLWETGPGGRPFEFRDSARDWFVSGSLKFSPDLTIGLQVWEQREGTASAYGDWARASGGLWVPGHVALFATYSRPVGRDVSLSLRGRYKKNHLDPDTTVSLLATYANAYFDVLNLLERTPAQFRAYHLSQVSSQFQSEVTAVYRPSERLTAILGIELRDGSIQSDFQTTGDRPLFSYEPSETPGQVKSTDLGFFAQGSFKWRETLKLVAGGRYDVNHVGDGERVILRTFEDKRPSARPVESFAAYVSPRVALVGRFGRAQRYLRRVPGDLVLKAIYSKASQQPSNFQRFAHEPIVREFPSPFLAREHTRNVELSVGWEPSRRMRLDVSAYAVRHSDVLHTALKVDPCCTPALTGQFQSIGGFNVRGLEAVISKRWRNFAAFGNYSYTRPMNSERPKDQYGEDLAFRGVRIEKLPIGDIARHKFTLGGSARRGPVSVHARVNRVGDRPTGPATTSRLNPVPVPSYLVAHATANYEISRNALVQGGMMNLFNTQYWDPGVRSAQHFGFAGRVAQSGFAAYLRVVWQLNTSKRQGTPLPAGEELMP